MWYIVLSSNKIDDCDDLCNVMFIQSKYDEAIKECTKAIELNPSYTKAFVRRAEAHEKLEHFEEALTGEEESFVCFSSTKNEFD